MASVNDNLNSQRPLSTGGTPAGRTPADRTSGRPSGTSGAAAPGAAGASPATPPARPRTPTDKALIAARPQTEGERQQSILQAVKAAQGEATSPKGDEEDSRTVKAIADGVGVVDGIREGTRIATSVDDLARLPGIGKAVQSGSRIGRFFTAIAESKLGKAIAAAFQNNKVLAPVSRFLGRVAPVAGLVVAGFDIRDADKTHKDPKATTTEKTLATTKAVLSGIAGVAGVATLALAPTGIGAAIAGGVALGAGLISLGVDLFLGKLRKDRAEASK